MIKICSSFHFLLISSLFNGNLGMIQALKDARWKRAQRHLIYYFEMRDISFSIAKEVTFIFFFKCVVLFSLFFFCTGSDITSSVNLYLLSIFFLLKIIFTSLQAEWVSYTLVLLWQSSALAHTRKYFERKCFEPNSY